MVATAVGDGLGRILAAGTAIIVALLFWVNHVSVSDVPCRGISVGAAVVGACYQRKQFAATIFQSGQHHLLCSSPNANFLFLKPVTLSSLLFYHFVHPLYSVLIIVAYGFVLVVNLSPEKSQLVLRSLM